MHLDPTAIIQERQRAWARRHGIHLVGSNGDRGALLYTDPAEANLFEPLSDDPRGEYGSGDGGELGTGDKRGKMQAVHSSSAICCNVFHYWRRLGRVDVIAAACGLPAGAKSVSFERHLPIDPKQFRRAPNLDAVFDYGDHLIAVESKFTEPFSTRAKAGLSAAYLAPSCADFWAGLPTLRALAESVSPENAGFKHLDAPQLLKHILGLRKNGGSNARLLYLYYDVPGSAGAEHEAEAKRFAKLAIDDHVPVITMTYQEVIMRLLRGRICSDADREEHAAYLDYVAERYL